MFIVRRIAVGILSFLTITGSFSVSMATNIPVPNGDFTNSSNDGTVGGLLINPNGGPVNIGSGPWQGSWTGVAGLLAPPSLNITDAVGGGTATISGVVNVDLLTMGFTSNGGNFSNLTGTPFVSGTTYQLTADVNVGSLLSLGVLQANSGVGIGLTNGSTLLANTTTSPASLVSLTLLSGTTYQLTLDYTATSSGGDIGITLFDKPPNVLTTTLFGSATFSNVGLATVPEPAPIVLVCVGLLGLVGFRFLRYRHRLWSLAW